MEIHPSAGRHDIADEDIERAIRQAPSTIRKSDSRLYLAPSRSTDLLEVVTGGCCPEAEHGEEEVRQDRRRQTDHGRARRELADKAEAGCDVDDTLHRRGGRPSIGSAAASVESVRLDPALREALAERAQQDHETTSSVTRKALREYLQAG